MFLRGCAASVEVRDLNAVPLDYQSATVTLPASMLNDLSPYSGGRFSREGHSYDRRYLSQVADKRAIRHAIEVGIEVPGAELITG